MNDSVPQWQMEEEEEGQDLVGQEVGGGALPLTSVDSLGNSFALWDNEVAELTWENGQLAMHGLGPPKLTASRLAGSRQAWDAGGHPAPNYGTLECIVKQGTLFPVPDKVPEAPQPADLPPWFTDALVPCAPAPVPTPTLGRTSSDRLALDLPPSSNLSTGVSSCPCPYPIYAGHGKKEDRPEAECQNIATVPEVNRLGSSWCISERRETIRSLSGVGSATIGTGYLYTTLDTCGTSDYAGELNTSLRSPENTSTNKDDLVSVSHTTSKREEEESGHRKRKRGCSSISSARRSRAASVHNQSERKRRDRINQKMKVLQKLIPNSSKTDKASILDEVIEYVKQLQATVQMMSQTSMPNMMMPMSIQQLMCMLVAQMGMGMNTGIRPGHAGIQPFLNPASFMQPNLIPTAAHSSDKLKEMIAGASLPDPISAILACQTRVECQGQLS